MTAQILVTVLAGVLLAVAAFGTVFFVLPGSPLAFVVLIGWGWFLGSAASWTAAAIGAVLVAIGWSVSFILTGRRLRKERVPRRSLLVAVVAGIVGMFVIPVAGLFIGFAAGLLAAEYARRRDARAAVRSGVELVKVAGIGIVVEFAMVALASSVWTIGVIVHFVRA